MIMFKKNHIYFQNLRKLQKEQADNSAELLCGVNVFSDAAKSAIKGINFLWTDNYFSRKLDDYIKNNGVNYYIGYGPNHKKCNPYLFSKRIDIQYYFLTEDQICLSCNQDVKYGVIKMIKLPFYIYMIDIGLKWWDHLKIKIFNIRNGK